MRLNQVTAAATDLDASIAFYQTLGLHLIVRSPHYARFEAPRGEATFSLHITDGPVPREHAPQLYFEVLDVDFEVRRMKHAGYAIEHETKDQTWLWTEAWLRDPAGNSICLFHAGENRRYPPWRIDASPGANNMHLVIRDGEAWSLVKFDGGADDWRPLQDRYGDYKASLGPFDLFSLLAMLEREWPDMFLQFEQSIRAFAESEETELTL
jgi:catechol 2,3-dioxygenase-like lactoylglutathione lyase family enzyme